MNTSHEPNYPHVLHNALFPIGVLVTLAIAYLLDRWLFTQTRVARSGDWVGIQNPLLLWTVASGIVLFAAWLALSWIALARSRISTLVSIIILVIGLSLYLYPELQLLFAWVPMLFVNIRTPLSYTGLFVAVLSILKLLLKVDWAPVR